MCGMTHPAPTHTDITPTHIIYKISPKVAWPYLSLMRLDRPIGTWLLLLPGWWSLAMVDAPAYFYALFALGALIMRGAGCVINDLWDRDFDKAVERTKSRPLASGAVTPYHAMVFLAGLLLTGLIILLQLSPVAIGLGGLSLIPVILYPLAKRVTWYPQAVLGLTFNFGALMGGAAVTNTVSLPSVLLYAAGFFWTLGYDTIYAHQDIADDSLIGVKSTARKFGARSPQFITMFYSLAAALIFSAGFCAKLHPIFYLFWGFSALHMMWQIRTWKMDDAADCLKKFRSNRDFALLIFIGVWCANLV
jgi:4-hydroxybenzoate polyprenyltransferase